VAGLVAETLAIFMTILFIIWAVRRLRKTAFIGLAVPLALIGSSACGRRRTAS
jgi:flagellar biogenesis protein FliO